MLLSGSQAPTYQPPSFGNPVPSPAPSYPIVTSSFSGWLKSQHKEKDDPNVNPNAIFDPFCKLGSGFRVKNIKILREILKDVQRVFKNNLLFQIFWIRISQQLQQFQQLHFYPVRVSRQFIPTHEVLKSHLKVNPFSIFPSNGSNLIGPWVNAVLFRLFTWVPKSRRILSARPLNICSLSVLYKM